MSDISSLSYVNTTNDFVENSNVRVAAEPIKPKDKYYK